MKKDAILLNHLKNLSPRFKKIVEKALEKEINIITEEKCIRYLKKIGRLDLFPMPFATFQVNHRPDARLNRIIIVSLPSLSVEIEYGDLGVAEITFAHEMGHLLPWIDKLPCNKKNRSCAYREVLATKTGFDILKELSSKRNPKFLRRGKPVKALDILGQNGYPRAAINDCRHCWVLKNSKITNCPKEKEVVEFVSAIEKSNL